jgi:hypothetical protein
MDKFSIGKSWTLDTFLRPRTKHPHQNATSSNATVTFIFSPGEHMYKFKEDPFSDTLVVELANTPENSFWQIDFGIGTWEVQGSLDSLVAALESIRIQSLNFNETFDEKQDIRNYLEDKLVGRFKETIEIKLE